MHIYLVYIDQNNNNGLCLNEDEILIQWWLICKYIVYYIGIVVYSLSYDKEKFNMSILRSKPIICLLGDAILDNYYALSNKEYDLKRFKF